ncbi:diguanylate cyclase [Devosia soli]|uniref:Diguanylate cyclase n=1 Tax=Devosia soli TaxID=361041 RepID=A0A0F5LF71_9HYPH|nr:diguanylate cyclase [Devosia soli]
MPGFDAILDSLPDPVLLLEAQGAILWCNTAANRAFEQVDPSLPVSAIFPRLTQSLPAVTAPVHLQLESGHQKFEATLTRLDANFIILTARAPQSTSLTRDDVDELTGAAKRNALMRAIDGELAGARQFAVHCIDLDRFKVINDTLGHGVGDLLLQKVADRLKSACRAGDMVARLGGDEFVILQRDVPSSEEAERLSARIVDLVGRTYVLSGHTINIGASVGVALREERQQARDLLRDADLALYEAKRAGKGRFRVFEPDMQVSLRERRELEIDLRRALALRQFRLNYQPFVELEGNNIRGFEALLRWQHPVRGNVPPLDFIPMAEETGLIVKIGEWVLRTACEAAVSWPENLTIAVNVSPLQFKSDNLLDTVEATLKETGLAANRLELEITESALLDDTENVLATLHALRGLGVKISMDDFGTGYSSLSYLQKFPFDKIKIDRSFVVGESSDSQAILKAVAGLGSSLGIAITAEGVETSDQLEHIRSQNCTHVQGYFTGRPMNDAAVADLLQSQMRKNTNA